MKFLALLFTLLTTATAADVAQWNGYYRGAVLVSQCISNVPPGGAEISMNIEQGGIHGQLTAECAVIATFTGWVTGNRGKITFANGTRGTFTLKNNKLLLHLTGTSRGDCLARYHAVRIGPSRPQ